MPAALISFAMQEHLETFLAQIEADEVASLLQFVKDEFEAFLDCGILAHGFCACTARAASARSWSPLAASCAASVPRVARGAWRRTPHIWWITSSRACGCGNGCCRSRYRYAVYSPCIPNCSQQWLQIIHCVITTFLIRQTGVKRKDAARGVITLIQRFGSASGFRT